MAPGSGSSGERPGALVGSAMKRSWLLLGSRHRARGPRGLEASGGEPCILLGDGLIHRGGEVGGPLVARVRVLRGGPGHHVVEGRHEVGALQARGGRRVGDVRPQLGHVVVLGEGNVAGEHLVEHTTQRVHIGPAIHLARLDLLRRHVVRGAHPRARAGEAARRPQALGEPEVGEVHMLVLALPAQENVPRLHVPVHQTPLVSRIQRRRHRRDDPADPVQVELARIHHLAQIGAGHEAHGQVENALELAAPVNRNDVRMLNAKRPAAPRS